MPISFFTLVQLWSSSNTFAPQQNAL